MKQTYLITILIFLVQLAQAQHSIRGTVVDNEGQTIPGASILIKGTKEGVVTDIDGKFNLELPQKDATLVVSFLGYTKQEIEVAGQSTIDIVLTPDFVELDEIVVVGYGTMRKSDLTGSISSVKVEENVARQYSTVDNLLRGRAAGVQVSGTDGNPGMGISVKIRGTNSLRGNNQPLYVVDGVVISSAGEDAMDASTDGNSLQENQNGLNGINPRDIESIEVLKDASATAIYGSRGANGVVLITTKQGVPGETRINTYFTSSLAQISKKIEVLDGEDYARYRNEEAIVSGSNPNFQIQDGQVFPIAYSVDGAVVLDEPYQIINWQDEIYQYGISYNAGASVSGGFGDDGSYYISGGYNDQSGIVEASHIQSGDFRLNLNSKVNEKLKLDARFAAYYSQGTFAQNGSKSGGSRGFINNVVASSPILDNEIIDFGNELEVSNPYSWLNDFEDYSEEGRFIGSLGLTYDLPVKGLKFQFKAGGNIRNKKRSKFYGLTTYPGAQSNGVLSIASLDTKSYTLNNLLMYNRTINKIHRVNSTIGFTYEGRDLVNTLYEAQNFATTDFTINGAQYAAFVSRPLTTLPASENLLSYLGRVNYTLMDKYILTASFRVDGSSKFADGNKYGFFPSFSVAWRASDESFIQSLGLVDELKVRAGWGRIGNQGINPYQTVGYYNRIYYASPDNSDKVGFVPANIPNPDLTWETTEQINVGIDVGIFNNRLTATADIYSKKTTDLLQQVEIPTTSGFENMLANRGTILNKGLEISLNATALDKNDWYLSVGGNIAFNRTELQELGIPDAPILINGEEVQRSYYLGSNVSSGTYFKAPANIFLEGEQIGLFYGWETDGIYQTDDQEILSGSQPGDVKRIDQNGDGVIDGQDRVIIGNPNPDFIFGANLSLQYKRFSLNVQADGVYGNDIANGNLLRLATAEGTSRNIIPAAYHEAWRPDLPSNTFPRIGYIGENNAAAISDRIIEDGSYLRLNNVTLGYDLPVEKVVSSCHIYFSAQNLLTLTNYSGYDPVITSYQGASGIMGVDWINYPNARVFILGLNLNF